MVFVLAALLLVCAAAAAWVLARQWQSAAPGPGAGARRPAPTFLAMDNMVVNLHDAAGERFVQIGITLELEDAQTAEQVRQYLPVIRSGILLLVSQRSAAELLRREGKERLAADIQREVARPLGYGAQRERPDTAPGRQPQPDGAQGTQGTQDAQSGPDTQDTQTGEPQDGTPARSNPVHRVLFSSFIIQ